ncbi:DUF2500 domain-containing protein [Caldanaerobacter subterraneus]|uniref:DUF2500 domain-containing protein n=3 Tax=Caldanaerobacter subterraneus TaxID=911092 RepID=U5CMZ9_CALSX|nr:DUF2500 domain-containing protein [Caldanaerobacter subterraneus]ERM91358.1 hypothetical protein O163_11010 [Caldanaerobacter subterraneus subsp. yonseiensis KB-1]NNG66541.1 DUF2500 domain-containing protein [Caldanaerobacter subterraneus]
MTNNFGFDTGDWFFAAHSIFFALTFVVIFIIIIYAIVKSIGEWRHNLLQPKVTSIATVVAKRTEFRSHASNNTVHGYTNYFITFEFETGDRQEFMVGADTYGYLVEGDVGKLTFQGKKFLSFERTSI